MFKCHKCNKIYKREKSFIRHEGSCQQKPRNTRPSLDQMWYIILKHQKQLAGQKKDIEKHKNIWKDILTNIVTIDKLRELYNLTINYNNDYILEKFIKLKKEIRKM